MSLESVTKTTWTSTECFFWLGCFKMKIYRLFGSFKGSRVQTFQKIPFRWVIPSAGCYRRWQLHTLACGCQCRLQWQDGVLHGAAPLATWRSSWGFPGSRLNVLKRGTLKTPPTRKKTTKRFGVGKFPFVSKGKECSFSAIHFQVQTAVSFRKGTVEAETATCR